tara:strand:+ start:58886 stop:59416 length:531 start_codon:yes stop_codon:yes gene_type:complete
MVRILALLIFIIPNIGLSEQPSEAVIAQLRQMRRNWSEFQQFDRKNVRVRNQAGDKFRAGSISIEEHNRRVLVVYQEILPKAKSLRDKYKVIKVQEYDPKRLRNIYYQFLKSYIELIEYSVRQWNVNLKVIPHETEEGIKLSEVMLRRANQLRNVSNQIQVKYNTRSPMERRAPSQ